MNIPMLLADLDSFVAGAFMVIMFIGWIINLVNGTKAGGKPANRRPDQPRPGQPPKSTQAEIEQFLNQARKPNEPTQKSRDDFGSDGVEVVERARNPQTRRAPPPEQPRRTQREIWEEQISGGGAKPRRTQQQQPKRQPQQKKASQQANQAGPAPAPLRPGEAISGRHITPATSVESRSQKSSLSENRIAQSVSRDLPSQISANVSSHLGTFGAGAATSQGERAIFSTIHVAETRAFKLGQLLKSTNGMRDAMIMNEIMTKPRALRNSSR